MQECTQLSDMLSVALWPRLEAREREVQALEDSLRAWEERLQAREDAIEQVKLRLHPGPSSLVPYHGPGCHCIE